MLSDYLPYNSYMDKKRLAKQIRTLTKGAISYSKAYKVVDVFIEVVKERLARDRKVVVTGLGTFEVKWRKARKSHNINTGKIQTVPGRYSIRYRPSKRLKEFIKKLDDE